MAAALGRAAAAASALAGASALASVQRRGAAAAEPVPRVEAGRFCVDADAYCHIVEESHTGLPIEKVPVGEVASVLECAPGHVVKYEMGMGSSSALRARSGSSGSKVCFDYAVVLSGRVDQYLEGSRGTTSFPKTMGPGGFLTEHAVLHNSWQVPCHIALVTLPTGASSRGTRTETFDV